MNIINITKEDLELTKQLLKEEIKVDALNRRDLYGVLKVCILIKIIEAVKRAKQE